MNRPKSMHPSGLSWRERQVQKEKDRVADELSKKEEERLRHLKITEDNFPSLGEAIQKPKPTTNSGVFAKLASEWREQDELEKARKQREEEENQRWRYEWIHRPPPIIPRPFQPTRTYEEEDEEESHTPKYGYEEERNWTTVEYNHRRPAEHRIRQFEYPEDEDNAEEELNAELAELGIRDY